jgi:hypothetical protein
MQPIQTRIYRRISLSIEATGSATRFPRRPGDQIARHYPGFDYHPTCP